MSRSEDVLTVWPLGSSTKLTRREARACDPPYLPPPGRKFARAQQTAHVGPNGQQLTAGQAHELGLLTDTEVKKGS